MSVRTWVWTFGLVCGLFISSVASAESGELMTFEEFKQLTERERGIYVENLQQLVLGWRQDHPEVSTVLLRSPSPWSVLLPEAVAGTPGGSCIYAGHVSRYNAQGRCTRPTAIMQRNWTIATPDGKTVSQKLCSSPGQILCNPLVFGFGQYNAGSGSYSGMCVSSVETATADCETKYQQLPNYKAQHIANQLVASNLGTEFNTMTGQVEEYCKGLASEHRQTPLCEVAKKRTSFLRTRVANAAKAPREKLLSGLPAGGAGNAETAPRTEGKPADDPSKGAQTGAKPKPKVEDPEKPCNCTADQAGATTPVAKTAAELAEIQKNLCKPEAAAKPKPGERVPGPSKTYGLFGLLGGAMNSLMAEAQAKLEAAKAGSGGCPGGCSRKNSPRISVDTKPTGQNPSGACPASYQPIPFTASEVSSLAPGVNLAGDALVRRFQGQGGACDKGLQDWMTETLKGSSALGKNINDSKCTGECGLSNTLEITSSGTGGGCDLGVRWVIKCGPPKKDREWTSAVTIVHDWTCEPAGGK